MKYQIKVILVYLLIVAASVYNYIVYDVYTASAHLFLYILLVSLNYTLGETVGFKNGYNLSVRLHRDMIEKTFGMNPFEKRVVDEQVGEVNE